MNDPSRRRDHLHSPGGTFYQGKQGRTITIKTENPTAGVVGTEVTYVAQDAAAGFASDDVLQVHTTDWADWGVTEFLDVLTVRLALGWTDPPADGSYAIRVRDANTESFSNTDIVFTITSH